MILRVFAVSAVFAITGCATDRPTGAPPPERVEVPVPVACLPADLPAAPSLTPDAVLRTMTPRARYLRIASEREALESWRLKVEPAIAACRERRP